MSPSENVLIHIHARTDKVNEKIAISAKTKQKINKKYLNKTFILTAKKV